MRTRISRTLTQATIGVLLFGAVQSAPATTLDFEGLNDGDVVTNQFAAQGVTISNGMVLTVGVSLNEFEFPPRSGTIAIFRWVRPDSHNAETSREYRGG
jgi:hypothetical protein